MMQQLCESTAVLALDQTAYVKPNPFNVYVKTNSHTVHTKYQLQNTDFRLSNAYFYRILGSHLIYCHCVMSKSSTDKSLQVTLFFQQTNTTQRKK